MDELFFTSVPRKERSMISAIIARMPHGCDAGRRDAIDDVRIYRRVLTPAEIAQQVR